MDGQLRVPSLVPVVLWHVVKVFTSNDDRSAHLGRHNLSGQDTSSNRHKAGPGALLVCAGHPSLVSGRSLDWRCESLTDVLSVNSSAGRLEAKTNFLVPSLGSGRLASRLGVQEDGLLLESTLALDGQLDSGGCHDVLQRRETLLVDCPSWYYPRQPFPFSSPTLTSLPSHLCPPAYTPALLVLLMRIPCIALLPRVYSLLDDVEGDLR